MEMPEGTILRCEIKKVDDGTFDITVSYVLEKSIQDVFEQNRPTLPQALDCAHQAMNVLSEDVFSA